MDVAYLWVMCDDPSLSKSRRSTRPGTVSIYPGIGRLVERPRRVERFARLIGAAAF